MSRKKRAHKAHEIVKKEDEPPTPAEQAMIDRFRQRRDGRPQAPRVTAEAKPNQPVEIDHPTMADALGTILAFGTTEPEAASLLLVQLMNAACDGSPSKPPSEREINRALATVYGIGATDQLEGMLAVQMVATHAAAVRALRRLKGADTIQQQDSNGNLAIKLLRTFTAQMEALQRHRGKGHQKVTVEHVHVHAGGQAIVGSVSTERRAGGGGDHEKATEQPHAPKERGPADECGSPMRSEDAPGQAVQIPGGAQQAPMPHARRRKRQRRPPR